MNNNKIFVYFSTPVNPFWWPLSLIIRWMESNKKPELYHSSHTSIRIGDYVYESVLFLGTRKILFQDWYKKNYISMRYSVGVNHQDLKNIHAFCEGSIGVPYPFLELFGIMYTRLVKKLFKRQIDNPFNLINRKIKCTEMVFEALKNIPGLKLKYNGDINNMGVRDLEESILRRSQNAIPQRETKEIPLGKTPGDS